MWPGGKAAFTLSTVYCRKSTSAGQFPDRPQIGTCNSLIKGMVAIIDLFGVDKAMVLLFYCKMSANSLKFPNTQT